MDKGSFDTQLGAKLKAERATLKPAGKHRLIFATIVATIATVAGIIVFGTWIGN